MEGERLDGSRARSPTTDKILNGLLSFPLSWAASCAPASSRLRGGSNQQTLKGVESPSRHAPRLTTRRPFPLPFAPSPSSNAGPPPPPPSPWRNERPRPRSYPLEPNPTVTRERLTERQIALAPRGHVHGDYLHRLIYFGI